MAERKNRTLADIARAMMTEKNMLLYYWDEAVNTTNYILNRCITFGVHVVTLEERFYGRKPSLEYLKVFGCLAYVHVHLKKASLIQRLKKNSFCGIFRGAKKV